MNHSTITAEQQEAVAATLSVMPNIPAGVGSKENACSIAAINLALSGKLTDVIPDCMSVVTGRWIIKIQDYAPAELRNSERWRRLLPLAAGTGRDREAERSSVALEWMWSVVLPQVQPIADRLGFGEKWHDMCSLRTASCAANAAKAASAANAAAASCAASCAANASNAASKAANAAANAAAAADADFWHSVDPCGCLERMINLPEGDGK